MIAEEPITELTEEMFLLSRDLRKAAVSMAPMEARFLVDFYYQAQRDRIRAAGQIRAAQEHAEPHAVLTWFGGAMENIEKGIHGALHNYSKSKTLGKWCLSIYGIGPVITAGLMAHIDITKAPTVGHIWSFAGLDPNREWLGKERAKQLVAEVRGKAKTVTDEHIKQLVEAGPFKEATLRRFATPDDGKITWASLSKALARCPWDAELKTLCWKMGSCFVRLRGKPEDVYGKLYERRKEYELKNNEAGEYAALARRTLETLNIQNTEHRKAYEAGKLPAGRIEQRVRRWTVKMFLSHYHEAAYFDHYGKMPPNPFALDHCGHAHYIAPPNRHMIPGWEEAARG